MISLGKFQTAGIFGDIYSTWLDKLYGACTVSPALLEAFISTEVYVQWTVRRSDTNYLYCTWTIDQTFPESTGFPKPTVHAPHAQVSCWKTSIWPKYMDLFHIKAIELKQAPSQQKNLSLLTIQICWKCLRCLNWLLTTSFCLLRALSRCFLSCT